MTSPTPVPPTKVPDVFDDIEEDEIVQGVETAVPTLPSTLSTTVSTTSPSTASTPASTTMSSPVADISSTTGFEYEHEEDSKKEDADPDTELNDGADDQDLVPRLLPVETPDEFCESVNERHIIWPKTASGTTVEMLCPNNNEGRFH